jgi:hypothetical protein
VRARHVWIERLRPQKCPTQAASLRAAWCALAESFPPFCRLVSTQKGLDIMNDPLLNKGMAFSTCERDRLHLRGLLPPRFEDLETQCERVMRKLRAEPDPILKNMQLQARRPCPALAPPLPLLPRQRVYGPSWLAVAIGRVLSEATTPSPPALARAAQ